MPVLQTIKSNDMRSLFLILILVSSVFQLTSCYNDKEELLYGSTLSCDTISTISYSQKIVPIFQNACYGCHSGSSPSGAIAMGTFNADKTVALSGRLMGSLNHSSGYSAMPQGAAKLSSCNIAVIQKWVIEGTPNN